MMKRIYAKPVMGTIELWSVASMMAVSTEPQSDHNDSKKHHDEGDPFNSNNFWNTNTSSSTLKKDDLTF
jgi:hypothetical protein